MGNSGGMATRRNWTWNGRNPVWRGLSRSPKRSDLLPASEKRQCVDENRVHVCVLGGFPLALTGSSEWC